jgi:hypothetical protein
MAMTLESYTDGVFDLLRQAGVADQDLKTMTINELPLDAVLYMAFCKGRSFEDTARSVCAHYGIEVTD